MDPGLGGEDAEALRQASAAAFGDGDVMEHGPDRWPGQLTAAVVRGNTQLCVRLDEDVPCVSVEMDGTPCHVLLDVTASGAENLGTVIAAGLADLAACRQTSVGDATEAGADG